ncbi:ABC transporter permease [Pengzhenrongella frigida]|uniref:ABC transporter permease n=1 Tax=Pengzhenrongella frigida TaxID=1259133 RepID=A0A4Q5N3W5_9MICO|nr:ABC transporter permease [Cellulomonas sp. HLT2-17]RYV52949.1 ABC transporter permease [Cellulomonas sp. HLT2-17]
MGRVALRGIRAHLVRFILSVLAVTLGVAFVAGTFSLRTMMSSTFSGIVDSSMTGDAYVRGSELSAASDVGDTRNLIPASLAPTLADIDGVDLALPEISGAIVLVGSDGTAVTSTQAPSFGTALDPDDPSVTVVAGRLPRSADEIALESETLASSGLAVGDLTQVVLGGEVRDVTVVADVSMGAPMAGATIVFLDVPTATAVFAADGQVPMISVYAAPGVSETSLVDRLAPVLSAGSAEAVSGDYMRDQARTDIESMLGFVQTFMLVFAGISLFVGAFIISNTFSMSVRQRMREFALLRAVGASPSQVFASILIQAAVVGLLGSALGIAAGLGLVSLLRIAFEQMGMDLSGSIPLSAGTVVISLVIGTVVSIVAAALPARRAALTAPVEAMRDDVATTDKSLRVRAIAGTVIVAAGAAALLAALVRPETDGATMLGLGAGGLVVGVLVLAPVIARHTLGVLAAVFVAAVRPLGRLARGNVIRNPRRTANTAGALMIGMALVGAASVLAASATASTRAIVEDGWISDFSVQSATQAVPSGAVADVRGLATVGSVDEASYGSAHVSGPGEATTAAESMIVVSLPPEAFGRTVDIDVTDGSLATLADGELAVQKATAEDLGWQVGDQVTLAAEAGSVTAPVGAIIDTQMISAPIIVSDALLAQVIRPADTTVEMLLVTAAPGAGLGALRADLVEVAAPYVVLSVLDAEDFAAELANQVNQILVILYALLGLSIVIAILGIVNTLALSVIERTREIGLMRAVGLGRLQLAGIVTIESVLTAVFGTVVGVVVGVSVAAVMPTVFADSGLTTLVIPWAQLTAMLALAAVVGVLAALWPALRAARLPVLDAVASD